MESEKFQLHLASKVVVPAPPLADGKPDPKGKPRTQEIVGMSNRAVRFKQLDALQVQKLESDAAKMAGEDASFGDVRNKQLLYGVYEMVYAVSEPSDDPLKLDKKKGWSPVTFTDFENPASKFYGPKLFTSKDIGLLKQEYRRRHEMAPQEYELLTVGKALPVLEDGAD